MAPMRTAVNTDVGAVSQLAARRVIDTGVETTSTKTHAAPKGTGQRWPSPA
jgi:hypothetical protein